MNEFLLVASDVHSDDEAFSYLSKIASSQNCIGFLYAGDLDLENPLISLELSNRNYLFLPVLGNCDSQWEYINNSLPSVPVSRELTFHNLKIGITHGHLYIPFEGCDLVISGHTHQHDLQLIGKTVFLNPGSASRPRGRSLKSYSTVEFNENSVFVSIRELYSEAEISSAEIPVKK